MRSGVCCLASRRATCHPVAPIPQGGRITSTRLLAAALLAAGCSDFVSASHPRAEAPTQPAAAGPVATVALWGFNGTLPPQSGTTLGKEFNPENPPLGSTVIATFVWRGSSNIITSVTD